jgi:hypothetical protein
VQLAVWANLLELGGAKLDKSTIFR